MQSPVWGLIPQPWGHDPSQNQVRSSTHGATQAPLPLAFCLAVLLWTLTCGPGHSVPYPHPDIL